STPHAHVPRRRSFSLRNACSSSSRAMHRGPKKISCALARSSSSTRTRTFRPFEQADSRQIEDGAKKPFRVERSGEKNSPPPRGFLWKSRLTNTKPRLGSCGETVFRQGQRFSISAHLVLGIR